MKLTVRHPLYWLVLCMALALFTYLAHQVLDRKVSHVDTAILQWAHTHGSPLLDIVFLTITAFGNAVVIIPITLLIGLALWRAGKRQSAITIALCVAGAGLINTVLKLLFQRDRPSLWPSLLQETSFSFPSGHAMATSALAFSVIIVAWRTRWRWPVVAGSLLMMLLVGYSRLYFGVHYPTDVIAGWCASAVWTTVVLWILSKVAKRYIRLGL